MAETGTASTITPSISAAVTFEIEPVVESSTGDPVFNGLFGFWISDAIQLPGTPVTGSVVRWSATVPAGATLAVETSVNNGASWDVATNNSQVPRLREGDTATPTVLARITMTRPTLVATSPKVSSFELLVSVDASVDELVPIGHGMVDKVTVESGSESTGGSSGAPLSGGVISRGGGGTGGGTSITVHATDLSRAVSRNIWQQPFTVPGGLNYGDAIKLMIQDRLPSQTEFSIATTTRTTPLLVYGLSQGTDPWQDIQELAAAVGFEAFFDAKGVFVFRPVPDPRYGVPVWSFDSTDNPTIVESKRQLSDEQTFNDIVVIGQSSSSQNPVSAEAYDDDPSSPTYILGPYGRVSQRVTFSLITTEAQAQDAANATLYNSLGAAETVTIVVVPMPALEPGDVIAVTVPETGTTGTYYINSMTTSLSPAEPQQLVCFRQSRNV
jgi:hypothetical protein